MSNIEYELKERGFSHFKPAFFELTDKQRDWLMIGGTDPQKELFAVLDTLPGETLIPWCRAYADDFNGFEDVDDAEDAHEQAWDLAGCMVADVQEIGARLLEKEFPTPLANLDHELRAMLVVLAREVDGEFYD